MKLIVAIVKDSDDAPVLTQLVSQGFRVTRVASSGGFLRRGNVTLLIGVEPERLQAAIDLLNNTCCPPAEPGQYRATLFVLDAPFFEQV
jgi:uncharacterized protein YaaQ